MVTVGMYPLGQELGLHIPPMVFHTWCVKAAIYRQWAAAFEWDPYILHFISCQSGQLFRIHNYIIKVEHTQPWCERPNVFVKLAEMC